MFGIACSCGGTGLMPAGNVTLKYLSSTNLIFCDCRSTHGGRKAENYKNQEEDEEEGLYLEMCK